MTNEGIRVLEQVATLEILDLTRCKFLSDVTCLGASKSLRTLEAGDTRLTNEGIRGLERIDTLHTLGLRACPISDVRCLRDAKALRKLDLSWTDITPDGLEVIETIPTLRFVMLSGFEKVPHEFYRSLQVTLRHKASVG